MKNTKKKLVAFIMLVAMAVTSYTPTIYAKNVMDYEGTFWGGTGKDYSELKSRTQSNNEKIKKLKKKYKDAQKKEKAAKKKGIKVYGSLQLTGDGKTYMIIPHDKEIGIDEDYGYIVDRKKASSSNYATSAGNGYYTWRLRKGKNTHKYGGDTYSEMCILVVREDAPVNTTTRVYYGNYGSNASSYIDITIEPEASDDYDDGYDDEYDDWYDNEYE